MPAAVFALLPYLNEKEIRREFNKCLKTARIAPEMRAVLQKLADFSSGKLPNMVSDGSFEKDGIKKWKPLAGRKLDKTTFVKGKQSASFRLKTLYGSQRVSSSIPGKPGNYLFAAYVRIPADYPPYGVKASCMMVPRRANGNSMTYYVPPEFDVIPGKWTLLYTFSHVPEKAAATSLLITFKGMKEGDQVWVDDVMFLPMGKLPAVKKAPPKSAAQKKNAGILPSAFARWTFTPASFLKEKDLLAKGDDKGNLILMGKGKTYNFFSPAGIAARKGDQIKITFRASGKGALTVGLFAYRGNSWSNNDVKRKVVYLNKEEKTFTYIFPLIQEATGTVRPFLSPGRNGEVKLNSWSISKVQ